MPRALPRGDELHHGVQLAEQAVECGRESRGRLGRRQAFEARAQAGQFQCTHHVGRTLELMDGRGIVIALKITHQEMANLIGSTRETVSLTLSQFKRKGLIQNEGRRVILADREGLKALA